MKDSADYASAIRSIIDLPETEYLAMCQRAKDSSKEYDYPYLTKQMADIIEKL